MKLKTSFFEAPVLKKNLLRFSPVWAVYIIIGLLVLSNAPGSIYSRLAEDLSGFTGQGMVLIVFLYAAITALLVFGDLFNSRLCNALHAMPLRRENWFITNFISGILFGLLPNLLFSLLLATMLDGLWFIAFLWLGGVMLQYIFFFGLMTLCVMSTGNRFAAMTTYGLLNFVAMELYWVVSDLFLPLLNGVRLQDWQFMQFTPVVQVMNFDNMLPIVHSCLPDCLYYDRGGRSRVCIYEFLGFGEGWGYLWVIAGIGLVLAGLALLLYRRRNLECAGNFAAIIPVKWLISICGSLGCGMVFRAFAYNSGKMEYFMLLLGTVVGFFLCRMLLQRKVKVFDKKGLITVIALVLILFICIGLCAIDALGIERYIPKQERVEKVLISDRYVINSMGYYQFDPYYHNKYIILEDPQDIANILQAHEDLLQVSPDTPSRYTDPIHIQYQLKSGRIVTRSYRMPLTGKAYQILNPYFKAPSYIFGADSLPELLDGFRGMFCQGYAVPLSMAKQFLSALWTDASNGLLVQDYSHHTEQDSVYVELGWKNEAGDTQWRNITVWENAKESWSLIQSFLAQQETT